MRSVVYIYFYLLIILFGLMLTGCKNDGGSVYAMERRYDNFLSILPSDIAEDFLFTSKDYSEKYREWQSQLSNWIETVTLQEREYEIEVASRISQDRIEYALDTLTARNYERNLPTDLMAKVKKHSDILALSIKDLEKETSFSNALYKLKENEAIVNFTTEELTFYYVWNYLIGLNRERRFQ